VRTSSASTIVVAIGGPRTTLAAAAVELEGKRRAVYIAAPGGRRGQLANGGLFR
jgi:hypothetical protein